MTETMVLMFSVHAGIAVRFLGQDAGQRALLEPLFPKAALFAAVMLLTMLATGLYQRGLRDGTRGIAARLGVAFLLGFAILSGIHAAVPLFGMPPGAFALALFIAFVGVVASRALFYPLTDFEPLRQRVLVVGSGMHASHVESSLRRRSDRRGISVVGFVHIRGEHDVVDPSKVLHIQTHLLDLVREHQVDELVIAVDDRKKNFPVDEIIDCKLSGVRVIDMITLFERQIGKIQLDVLAPSTIIFLDGFSQAVLRSYGKRAFDVVVSSLMLLGTLPFMLLTALAIKLEEGPRAPVFYRQIRVGRNNHPFEIIKFRSMRVDAEKFGVAQWAEQDDPRITRTGRFIRKVRIDELPQLINVLRGEMSFVGPRPERPQFVDELAHKIPYYNMRHRVNPGITGWAQVRYPYGASEKDAKEKLAFDLYYIKNYSLFLDLNILFQTAQVILWGQGAR